MLAAALFQIILLGTGNPRPEMDRFGPSILIEAGEHRILLDCGRGATQRIFERDIPLGSVDRVLFTHLHSDHVTGFPDFWLTGWLFGRAAPLQVWGPRGTTSMIRNVERAYAFDVHMRRDVRRAAAGGGRPRLRRMKCARVRCRACPRDFASSRSVWITGRCRLRLDIASSTADTSQFFPATHGPATTW